MFDLAQSTVFLGAESFVSGAGRALLRVAAMLFLAYMVTMFLTLTVWSTRSATRRPALAVVRGESSTQAVRPAAAPVSRAA